MAVESRCPKAYKGLLVTEAGSILPIYVGVPDTDGTRRETNAMTVSDTTNWKLESAATKPFLLMIT